VSPTGPNGAHAPRGNPSPAIRLAEPASQTALCLDFDGTLALIVEDPEAARPLSGVIPLLGRLAPRSAAVALVSGRPATFLAEHAAVPGVRYLGLYGLQEIQDDVVRVDPRLEIDPANMFEFGAGDPHRRRARPGRHPRPGPRQLHQRPHPPLPALRQAADPLV
jgi:hypothetical protein